MSEPHAFNNLDSLIVNPHYFNNPGALTVDNNLGSLTHEDNELVLPVLPVVYVPVFGFGMVINETTKEAIVEYEYGDSRRTICFGLPTMDEVKIRRPKKINGFLIFKNCFLRELQRIGETTLMPHTMTGIAGCVWRATNDANKAVFLSLANKVMASIRSDMEARANTSPSYFEFRCRHCKRRNRFER